MLIIPLMPNNLKMVYDKNTAYRVQNFSIIKVTNNNKFV